MAVFLFLFWLLWYNLHFFVSHSQSNPGSAATVNQRLSMPRRVSTNGLLEIKDKIKKDERKENKKKEKLRPLGRNL